MDFGMPTLIELYSLSDTVSLCKTLGLRFVELNMNLPWYQPDKLSADMLSPFLDG
ncbi:MAG: sugar phosphate isomerase/epimerase, partial [Clostridiales bacterium]|nr:sugar phosphate isomerase/epimerase [Clostridiales bacterium]